MRMTIVSIANQNRSGTGTGDLAGESLKAAWEIVSGQNPDAAAKVWNSAKEGAKIAAMFGGGLRMIDLAGQNIISATVQPPVDSDIISTAQLWAEQFNDAFAKHLEEVQMVNEGDVLNTKLAVSIVDPNPQATTDELMNGGEKANKIPNNPATTGHIFRDAEGHIPDTPQNRSLLEDVANSAQDFLGYDKYGNAWYTRQLPDGTFAWVEARNGNIFEGGINKTQKTWNPETGLKKP